MDLTGSSENLGAHEIVEQVLATERWSQANSKFKIKNSKLGKGDEESKVKESFKFQVSSSEVENPVPLQTENLKLKTRLVDNLVIMGMGEPLANYDNLLKALRILNAPWGGGIGARKITDFDERTGAANPQAGGGAVAIPAGDFAARRDGRDAQ